MYILSRAMKLDTRERIDDGKALEDLFELLPVKADWVVGFFTALITGPDSIPPAVWVPEVAPSGTFPSEANARANVDVLTRLYAATGETLRTTPEIICPEPDKPAEDAVLFCRGYLHAAKLHASWAKDEVGAQKLAPFEALENDGTTPEHREVLGKSVAELFSYWQSKRTVVHTTPKVGRNDPCPCGSGKKHKKCCGKG